MISEQVKIDRNFRIDLKPTQRRLLIPTAVVIMLLVGGFTASLFILQQQEANRADDALLESVSNDLVFQLREQSAILRGLGIDLSELSDIKDGLRAQNRQRLQNEYSPRFSDFSSLYGITHFYFHLPDHTNLVRLHQPQRFGDTITRYTLTEAERLKIPVSGLEVGPLGTLTLRVVIPVTEEGTVLGYVELGKEIEDLLQTIEQVHSVEQVVMMDKGQLDRSRWEEGMTMLGKSADWDRYPEFVIIHSSFGDVPGELDRFLSQDIALQNASPGSVDFDEKSWHVMYSSMRDASGSEVGQLMLVKDISATETSLRELLQFFLGGAAGLVLILFGILYFTLRKVDQSINMQQMSLRESESRLNEAQELAQIGSWEIDLVTNELTWSDEVYRIFGFEGERFDVTNDLFFEIVHPDDRELVSTSFRESVENREPYDVTHRLLLKDGSEKIVHERCHTFYDDEGKGVRSIGTVHDITQRKKREESLQEYSQRLETLHAIDQAILSATTLKTIAQVGVDLLRDLIPSYRVTVRVLDKKARAFKAMATGADEENWIEVGDYTPISAIEEVEIFKPVLNGEIALIEGFDSPGPHPPLLQALFDEGIRSGFSIPLVANDQVFGTLSLSSKSSDAFSELHLDIASEVANSLTIAMQQAQLLNELQASKEQIMYMSRRMVAIQEEERRYLAQELHDEVGGLLSSLQINLNTPASTSNGEEESNRIASEMVDSLIDQIKSVSLKLRPSILDDIGLFAALQWFIDRYQDQTKIEVDFQSNLVDETRFDSEMEITAYRIVQESLTNVSKHADSVSVEVVVMLDESGLLIRVADEGVGFDVDNLEKDSTMGLDGMKERAMLIGGHFECVSQPGHGTVIKAVLRA